MNDIWPNWSKPINVSKLLTKAGRKSITPDQDRIKKFTGVYAFTSDDAVVSRDNILYVGVATGGRQTLRSRLSCYLRRMAKGGPTLSKHAGADMLVKHHQHGDQRPGKSGKSIFVRWSKTEDPQRYEGTLISKLDPPYNSREEVDFEDAEDDE